MFKLMIADDNPYALDALRDVVDWEDLDLSLVGAFPNGQELLKAAQEDAPDVVITDISMPMLNGIALATELRSISPHIKIVFLSNYSNFEYAQKAVQLHITDYLLKPFNPTQLVSVMKHVVQELCEERLQQFKEAQSLHQVEFYRSLAIENYMEKLLCQPDDEAVVCYKLGELGFSLPNKVFLRIAHVLLPSQLCTSYTENSYIIRSMLQSHRKDCCELFLLSHSFTCFSVLILYYDPSFDVENLLSQLHIDIETTTGINTAISFSSLSNDFSALGELQEQAVTAASQKNTTKNAVISYDEILANGSKFPKKHSNDTISNYVTKMQEYIHANYTSPITTSDVSSAVFLSSSYANQCFNSECDCTIYEYITQCRIAKAKKMLADTDIKVSSIAELVGYNGKTSFYLAFKRNVGVSPAEYRYSRNPSEE